MPRYFFDVQNGETFNRIHDGIDLPDLICVRQVAATIMGEIAGTEPHSHARGVSVIARDTSNAVV